tara:strand:- start:9826 stop:10257 length:432 start_codon:yes stop_codon:yes gene_type:complete
MDNIEFFKDRLISIGDDALMDAKYIGLTTDDVIEAYKMADLPLPISLIPSRRNIGGGFESGWGNGYVKVSSNHSSYGEDYNHFNVMIHGGLTFAEEISDDFFGSKGYWIGFDTSHHGDDKEKWPKESVLKETKELLKQIYRLK